jgi:hypothetical protein
MGTVKACQICGYDCSQDETSVSIAKHTKAEGMVELAYLCLDCFARGILWASEKSKQHAHCEDKSSEPDNPNENGQGQ